jgi:predicted AAA+ superfamily ATPase
MLKEAKNFVKNNRITKSEIWQNISLNGKRLPQRFVFVKLKKYISDFLKNKAIEPRMVGIAGIRGVGKTTLLWQIANFVKNNFKGIDVYLLSMDIASDYGFESKVLIEALGGVVSPRRKVLLLFDEIQYMKNWSLMLKIIYDKFKNSFIVATGSSSLLIRSTVDLSTRWHIESLYPLSFTEFVMIKSWIKSEGKTAVFPEKGLGSRARNALFLSENARDVADKLTGIEGEVQDYFAKVDESIKTGRLGNYLNEYVFYHNIPRLLMIDEKNTVLNRTFDLLHRVLYQDLMEFYEQNEVEKVRKFLVFLALSDEINREKASQSLGIKAEKIDKIIESLIKSELLIRFPVYGGIKTRIKKEKVFFVSPTIRYAIIKQLYSKTQQFHSKLYEDIVALYLKRLFNGLVLYGGTGKEKKSPDFVVEIDNQPIPIEIGIGKSDLSQLDTIKGKKYGLLINLKSNKVRATSNNAVIPLKWFLLI